MNKRRFLVTSGPRRTAPGRVGAQQQHHGRAARASAALLTVSGAIGNANRGALDPVLDQMMQKHGIQFERAHQFDAAMLARLPAVTIHPTLEYDAKRHVLRGPLLATVLEVAGVAAGGSSAMQLGLRAVDGYNAMVSSADATSWRMLVRYAHRRRADGAGASGRSGRCMKPTACRRSRTSRLKIASRYALGGFIHRGKRG